MARLQMFLIKTAHHKITDSQRMHLMSMGHHHQTTMDRPSKVSLIGHHPSINPTTMASTMLPMDMLHTPNSRMDRTATRNTHPLQTCLTKIHRVHITLQVLHSMVPKAILLLATPNPSMVRMVHQHKAAQLSIFHPKMEITAQMAILTTLRNPPTTKIQQAPHTLIPMGHKIIISFQTVNLINLSADQTEVPHQGRILAI